MSLGSDFGVHSEIQPLRLDSLVYLGRRGSISRDLTDMDRCEDQLDRREDHLHRNKDYLHRSEDQLDRHEDQLDLCIAESRNRAAGALLKDRLEESNSGRGLRDGGS